MTRRHGLSKYARVLTIGIWLVNGSAAAAPESPLPGREPPGCAERAPETQSGFKKLVRDLQGLDDPVVFLQLPRSSHRDDVGRTGDDDSRHDSV